MHTTNFEMARSRHQWEDTSDWLGLCGNVSDIGPQFENWDKLQSLFGINELEFQISSWCLLCTRNLIAGRLTFSGTDFHQEILLLECLTLCGDFIVGVYQLHLHLTAFCGKRFKANT